MFAIVFEDLSVYSLFAEPWDSLRFFALRNLFFWAFVLTRLALLGLGVGLLYSLWYHHFNIPRAAVSFFRGLGGGLWEVITLPLGWRRVLAAAKLAFKESTRKRVFLVLLLFLVPFLFVAWYLPKAEAGQLPTLMAFVNIAMTFTLLPMIVFLVAVSLPNDIQAKTIQTVVTKPVRRLELIVGRILGYGTVFTLVLLAMGAVSGLFVYYNIDSKIRPVVTAAKVPVLANITPPGATRAWADEVFNQEPDAQRRLELAKRLATTPLVFKKKGQYALTGTNVGKEWTGGRSHIEGATQDAAHWAFRFDPDRLARRDDPKLGEAVRVQMKLDIFKTTKGDPTRTVGNRAADSGIKATVELINLKNPQLRSVRAVRVNHNRETEVLAPLAVFADGEVEAVVQCQSGGQYLGMAQPDLYLMGRETGFAANFAKSMVSLWLKVIFLVSVAVVASTMLKGFVAILFTVAVYVVGSFYTFMIEVATGQIKGGGPLESLIRLFTRANQVLPLDENNVAIWLVLQIDKGLLGLLQSLAFVVPNMQGLETAAIAAEGVDVPGALLIRNALAVVGYIVPAVLVAHFLFRNRELAS